MVRKLLIVALILSLFANAWLFRSRQRKSRQIASNSFLSNYQYIEQTKIFDAYNSPCAVALIGDSHIFKAHWSELLGIIVCNRGIGSDITQGVYNRIGEVVKAKPKICFIQTGSNDIDLKIPPDSILYYYKKIIDTLVLSDIRPVIMEITPVGPEYPNKQFNSMASVLNKHFRTMTTTISITTDANDLQPDGIHLTATGYEKWKVEVLRVLNQ